MKNDQIKDRSMLNEIVQPLTDWYRQNKRILPWRDQNNAYYTWVSEIMLQQTRVEAVKPYFQRFIGELPDVQALAECPEEKLMKLWEGLGYYNRVRNMQTAARTVVCEYEGVLPASYEELLSLKGIGNYTAGAIASIAYQIPVPAVDGNVLRVISRITEDRQDIMKQSVRRQIEENLLGIMPEETPGDFNQALMELGAVVCVPNGPARCEACPVSEYCLAYRHGTVEELPNLLGHLTREEVLDKVKNMQLEPLYIEKLPDAKHIFSHIEWRMTGYLIRVAALDTDKGLPFIFAEKKQSEKQYAIPSAFRAYVKYMKEESGK